MVPRRNSGPSQRTSKHGAGQKREPAGASKAKGMGHQELAGRGEADQTQTIEARHALRRAAVVMVRAAWRVVSRRARSGE